ncbi:MAG TPA: hypothetical protein VFR49_01805, partial [Solirubrobacteraceae bacterium]|nr:hypothetical protein [Solirubrobacteraceae bacterium]
MTRLPPFANEPLAELRRPAVRAAYREALAALDGAGPRSLTSLIDGEPSGAGDPTRSTDPGDPGRVVA